MKKSVFLTALITLFSIGKLQAQENTSDSPHEGFQFAIFMGGAFGDIKGKTNDGLNPVFRGSGTIVSFDFGYATQNWAFGLYSQMNGVSIKSVEVNDTAYIIQSGYSMDNTVTGIYLCRYFMPLNAYIRVRGGIGKFTISDAEFNELGTTDRGFGWSLVAGKDFLIGKKKRWGIGGFVCLSGIKCNDLPPWQSDTYSYFAPGVGVVVAFR